MSSKLKTLTRRNLVFFVLALVLGAWVLLRPEPVTSARKESLPHVFEGFAQDDVRRIELAVAAKGEEPAKRLVVEMADADTWRLASHYLYPIQSGADRLLDGIAGARLRAVVTERQETFDTYAGDKGWIDVTLVDSRGRTLASFGLGRYQYPDTFVRLGAGEDARIVKATGVVPNMASLDPKSWIDTRVWPDLSSTKMIRIDVEQRRDKRTITIVKRGESAADLEMGAPEKDPDGKLEYWVASPIEGDGNKIAVEDLAREFTGMLIEDIVAGPLTADEEQTYGFDDPELVVTFFHKEGEKVTKHKLTVGRKAEDEELWYVRRGGAAWVFAVSAGTGINRMRQAPEEFIEAPPSDGEGDGDAAGDPDGAAVGDPDGVASGSPDGDAPADPPKGDEPKKDDGDKEDDGK